MSPAGQPRRLRPAHDDIRARTSPRPAADTAGIVGPALLFASGVGLILVAAFPLREDAAGVTYDPGGHIVGGFMFFMTSAAGLMAVSLRAARDPRWRSLATYTLTAGIVAFAGFIAGGALFMPDDAPLHDSAGPYQRALVLAVLFPCRVLLSLRLLQVATSRQFPNSATTPDLN